MLAAPLTSSSENVSKYKSEIRAIIRQYRDKRNGGGWDAKAQAFVEQLNGDSIQTVGQLDAALLCFCASLESTGWSVTRGILQTLTAGLVEIPSISFSELQQDLLYYSGLHLQPPPTLPDNDELLKGLSSSDDSRSASPPTDAPSSSVDAASCQAVTGETDIIVYSDPYCTGFERLTQSCESLRNLTPTPYRLSSSAEFNRGGYDSDDEDSDKTDAKKKRLT